MIQLCQRGSNRVTILALRKCLSRLLPQQRGGGEGELEQRGNNSAIQRTYPAKAAVPTVVAITVKQTKRYIVAFTSLCFLSLMSLL